MMPDGAVREFIVTGKRKGDMWFIGAMTNCTGCDITIIAGFLKKDVTCKITLIKDGVNADIQAMDFKQIVQAIKAGETIDIRVVKYGGWAASIEPVN